MDERLTTTAGMDRTLALKILEDLLAPCECDDEDDEEQDDEYGYYVGRNGLSVKDIVDEFDLNFYLGNVVKYVLRAGKKTRDPIKDLEKALWNLEAEIDAQEEKCRARN